MKVKTSLDPRVVKLFSNPTCSDSMGDVNATRPSNVRPRPLGEVKAESVYFDPPSTPALCIEPRERQASQHSGYRMNGLHENLITTAIIGDVAAANSVPIPRKSSTAHGISGSSFSALQLISSLVTPISRTISIPQPRTNNTNGAILRINTAPSGFGKDKSVGDPCPSPVSSDSAVTDSTTMSSRSTKSMSTWGEYKRQISTAKRKEMCRRITELSKCDAVDMSDHMSNRADRRPIMILSQMPQREKEYDDLVAKADVVLQKKKTLPSVFMNKQKRPGSLVRETNVFSKALKNKPGYRVGQINDMIVGKSVDPNYTDKLDDASDETSDSGSVWSKGSAGYRRQHTGMATSRSNTGFYDIYGSRSGNPTPIQAKTSQLGPQTSRYRDKMLKLQGKSLPRLNTAESRAERVEDTETPGPSATSRSVPHHPHDARILREINAKCDKLQRQISISLMAPDKVWSQNGYFNTHQPAPITGPIIPQRQRRQPIHAIYRSFQRMNDTKTLNHRHNPPMSKPCDTKVRAPERETNTENDNDDPVPSSPHDDENNNNIATKTFHLTELDDTDFGDSDSDDQGGLSDSDDVEFSNVTLLKLSESDPIKQSSGAAKYQGPTSRISEDEAGSQFHIVNGESQVSQKEAYKILKALDKDVYVEYEHKKYRRSGTHGSLGNPDNPRVHFLKVKVSDTH